MTDRTNHLFAALADPTRRQLLTTLAENSPKTATQLAEVFPISRQGVLKHLDILELAGLVHIQPMGREKRYSLTPAPLQEVHSWIDVLGAKWDERLQRLKNLVESEEHAATDN